MEACGRNGTFKVSDIDVLDNVSYAGQAIITAGFIGKSWGKGVMSCWISGTPEEMLELCKRILKKYNSFQAEVLKSSLIKTEE